LIERPKLVFANQLKMLRWRGCRQVNPLTVPPNLYENNLGGILCVKFKH
jgi:hypothetical protein